MFKIQSIHGTNGVDHAIRYLGDKNTPAHTTLTATGRPNPVPKSTPKARKIGDHYYLPNQNGIYHRNLLSWGVNLTGDNVHNAVKDADTITSLKHHKLQGLQLIISPKQKLDPNNPNQIYRFQRFINGVTNELYGKDFASYCAIQCDNSRLHSPHMHAHIVTINTNMRNHKSIQGKTYSVENINKVIDHQIKLDNQRYPKHPIFTKPDISVTPKQRIKAKIKDSPDLRLVNHAVNKVLAPGYTIVDKRGRTRNISTNSTFKYALKQLGVEPYFKRHRSYYHDRDGNRIPVIKNGKVEHTSRGSKKYKYHLVHGLSYRIISNKKHNRIITGSKLAQRYPNCSYQHVHQALYNNYLSYVKVHQHTNPKIRTKFDVKKTIQHRKPSPEYKRVHVYHPNDVRDVLPNLRNSVKHYVYENLHEIEPIMTVNKKQGKHLKRTQHLYVQQPNPMETGMIRHYRNNLFGRLHRKYDRFKKKANLYKTKMINAFHSEANKAGSWLNKHHLGKIGNWVKLKFGKNKSTTYRFNQRPITLSNQLQAQTGYRYASNVRMARRIELNNRRILTSREVAVRDITNKPTNVSDVINGLHSRNAKRAFYLHAHEIVPMLTTAKYHDLGLKSDKLLNANAKYNASDVNLITDYYKSLNKRVTKGMQSNHEYVFNHYPVTYQRKIILQKLNQKDLSTAKGLLQKFEPPTPTDLIGLADNINNVSNLNLKHFMNFDVGNPNEQLNKHHKLINDEAKASSNLNDSVQIKGKPALKAYHDDINIHQNHLLNREMKANREARQRAIRRSRPTRPTFHDDGPTLG